MKVSVLRDLNPDKTIRQIATDMGYSGTNAVRQRIKDDKDVPETWYPELARLGYRVEGGFGADRGSLGGDPIPDEPEGTFRATEFAPSPPEGAPQAPQAAVPLNYRDVAGYIEGAYKLAAQFAIGENDPMLAGIIYDNAPAAGLAWSHWIESEPKVAALLQRMMIGTPLGEVIGVHVAIVFAYVLARSAAKRVAADAAGNGSGQAAQVDGSAGSATEDSLA